MLAGVPVPSPSSNNSDSIDGNDKVKVGPLPAVATTFVAFVAPWCVECKAGEPAWDMLSRRYDFKGGVRVVSVDCTGLGERACATHNVLVYPTLLAFRPLPPEPWSLPRLEEHGGVLAHTLHEVVPFPGAVADMDLTSPRDLESWLLATATTDATAAEIAALRSAPPFPIPEEVLPDDDGHWRADIPMSLFSGGSAKGFGGSSTSGCVAWRASAVCDPEGPHAPENDLSCAQDVLGNRAGYCDCGGGRREKLVDCSGSEVSE